jgi:SAM-dependent methyltransferase
VLDIGCGSGLQTLILAERLKTTITAIDNHRPVLERLKEAAELRRLNIAAQEASMFDLPFKQHSFDLIWAEGSIFVIGLERGLNEWRRYLKPGGYLAFSEMCWLEADPPQEIWDYFERVYPAMLSTQNCLSLANEQGYRVLEHFVLPVSAWWDDYYTPMLSRIKDLKVKNAGVPAAQAVYAECELEAEMHRRYNSSYGYVFFVLQA